MSKRKSPQLEGYLEATENSHVGDYLGLVPIWAWVSCAVLGVAAIFLGLKGLLALPVCVGLVSVVGALNYRRLTERDLAARKRFAAYRVMGEMRQLLSENKLHRWVDPDVLQMLETAAHHWSRIRTVFDGPVWKGRDVPGYWREFRKQALQASDSGMRDLVLISRACVGPPQRSRSDDLKGVVESATDWDFAEVLGGIKSLVGTDWREYSHKSPQSAAVVQHGSLIVSRLEALANDVEAKCTEIAVRATGTDASDSLQQIDSVLSELRGVRLAEEEIADRITLGH